MGSHELAGFPDGGEAFVDGTAAAYDPRVRVSPVGILKQRVERDQVSLNYTPGTTNSTIDVLGTGRPVSAVPGREDGRSVDPTTDDGVELFMTRCHLVGYSWCAQVNVCSIPAMVVRKAGDGRRRWRYLCWPESVF